MFTWNHRSYVERKVFERALYVAASNVASKNTGMPILCDKLRSSSSNEKKLSKPHPICWWGARRGTCWRPRTPERQPWCMLLLWIYRSCILNRSGWPWQWSSTTNHNNVLEVLRRFYQSLWVSIVRRPCMASPWTSTSSRRSFLFRKCAFLRTMKAYAPPWAAKGAAGIKPCVKCRNVLSGDRCSAVAGHVGIVETDFSKFWPMTQTEVDESVRILQSQPTQARLEEAEKLLGWNWTSLERSCLNRSSLRGWFDVEYIHFDSMHAYWSNGIIAQELGLWYDKVTRLGAVTLDHLQAYVDIGWRAVPGTNAVFRSPKQYFTDKLFRKGVDYRGDAQFVLAVLPLCVAFGEELLRGRNAALDEALDSLVALQNVSVCILDSKVSVTFARPLHVLQQEHMRCFVKAYGAHVARPKLHYATHLKNQCEEWNRMIDCFVCERKHRAYKTLWWQSSVRHEQSSIHKDCPSAVGATGAKRSRGSGTFSHASAWQPKRKQSFPKHFQNITACVAVYRPGASSSTICTWSILASW